MCKFASYSAEAKLLITKEMRVFEMMNICTETTISCMLKHCIVIGKNQKIIEYYMT